MHCNSACAVQVSVSLVSLTVAFAGECYRLLKLLEIASTFDIGYAVKQLLTYVLTYLLRKMIYLVSRFKNDVTRF